MTLFLPGTPTATDDLHGRTVLVLHAHPDDEAIFTGATIRRLADAGARVVLVTATNGELGETLVPLPPGESLAQRRVTELERAATVLGVARLVVLGHRDSGLPGGTGGPDGTDPRTLVRAEAVRVARRVAELAVVERAEAVVHYDGNGIYGHPDHVAVHRIGRLAARFAGVTAYEATVDREHLHFAGEGAHLVHAAARAATAAYGHVTAEIGLALAASAAELAAKRDAMAAHASQVRPAAVAHAGFADAYQMEWYLRDGPPGLLDRLGNVHALAAAP